MQKNIGVIGAGLVGSLLSIYLSKRGYKVTIFERRPDIRKAAAIEGRSINLALSDRGIRALEQVGIMDEIRKIAIPMHGRQMHNSDGSTAYQPYGNNGQYINSVSRGKLNIMLMNLAEQSGVKINFEKKLVNINWQNNELIFEGAERFELDLIFGSDGAYSAARLSHHLQQDRFQYEQSYIDFGYKELTIPSGTNQSFQLDKNEFVILPVYVYQFFFKIYFYS